MQFHQVLYSPLNNRTLLKVLEVFWLAFQNVASEEIRISDPRLAFEQHHAIFESVKARDPALTRQRLRDHFGSVQTRIQRAVLAGEFKLDNP